MKWSINFCQQLSPVDEQSSAPFTFDFTHKTLDRIPVGASGFYLLRDLIVMLVDQEIRTRDGHYY